jgi:hypothetical protein
MANETMTVEELKDENERLRAQLAQKDNVNLSFKVSEKGAVSVYGLGQFPTTLYKGQWEKLLDHADDLRAFLKANESRLASK